MNHIVELVDAPWLRREWTLSIILGQSHMQCVVVLTHQIHDWKQMLKQNVKNWIELLFKKMIKPYLNMEL